MEEDKKEKNTESVEKKASAQGGGGNNETRKQENKKTRKQGEEIGAENTETPKSSDVAGKKQEQENEISEEVDSSSEKVEESKDEDKDAKTKVIYPDVVPGANVKIYQKIKEKKGKEEKERIQVFEGIVLARKGGSSAGATVSVKKICKGGFEVKKIYPLHSPIIAKIEIIRQAKVRQAKLGFLKRNYKKKLRYNGTKTQKQ
jgi:large subunit ribosomal protein L19